MMADHVWVKHTIANVETIADDDGDPVIFVDPDEAKIAEDGAMYGCDRCGESIRTHYNTPCEAQNDALRSV